MSAEQERDKYVSELVEELRQAQERQAALRKLLIESNHYTEKELAESLTTQDSEA